MSIGLLVVCSVLSAMTELPLFLIGISVCCVRFSVGVLFLTVLLCGKCMCLCRLSLPRRVNLVRFLAQMRLSSLVAFGLGRWFL